MSMFSTYETLAHKGGKGVRKNVDHLITFWGLNCNVFMVCNVCIFTERGLSEIIRGAGGQKVMRRGLISGKS